MSFYSSFFAMSQSLRSKTAMFDLMMFDLMILFYLKDKNNKCSMQNDRKNFGFLTWMIAILSEQMKPLTLK